MIHDLLLPCNLNLSNWLEKPKDYKIRRIDDLAFVQEHRVSVVPKHRLTLYQVTDLLDELSQNPRLQMLELVEVEQSSQQKFVDDFRYSECSSVSPQVVASKAVVRVFARCYIDCYESRLNDCGNCNAVEGRSYR